MASGGSYTIPYTEENEESVISKMEVQARNAEVRPLSKKNIILAIGQPLMLPIAIITFIQNGGWLYGIILAMIVEGTIEYPVKCIINAMKKRDIKKLNYFLDHQQELNDHVGNNENMLLNVSKKTVSQIKTQQAEGKKPFKINNIDNYSLSDLRTLKENLERIISFNFNEDKSMLEKPTLKEQEPVLRKAMSTKQK